jgi:hypothetical protein
MEQILTLLPEDARRENGVMSVDDQKSFKRKRPRPKAIRTSDRSSGSAGESELEKCIKDALSKPIVIDQDCSSSKTGQMADAVQKLMQLESTLTKLINDSIDGYERKRYEMRIAAVRREINEQIRLARVNQDKTLQLNQLSRSTQAGIFDLLRECLP